MSTGAGEVPGASGQPRPRRRHRRVVALSEVDRRRLESGDIADPVDALHAPDTGPLVVSGEPGRGEGANDARLLRDVPPHWGRR
ncbi:hypothetical protein KZX45_11155 [Georgenia sp. EYE_87]|uniref:hypothetical protein n=1 Tax=Georgenia sp. EYE_87 TaxID=2853448 RepID=UPI0020034EB7|nr:hypothetical protein [Georgenia sp. EYE_87]MCK6211101.1 hypothetical protein [Georgenia sp. EYE_87]